MARPDDLTDLSTIELAPRRLIEETDSSSFSTSGSEDSDDDFGLDNYRPVRKSSSTQRNISRIPKTTTADDIMLAGAGTGMYGRYRALVATYGQQRVIFGLIVASMLAVCLFISCLTVVIMPFILCCSSASEFFGDHRKNDNRRTVINETEADLLDFF